MTASNPRPDARHRIAAHVRGLPPSGIRRFFDLVAAMDGVISLGVGEPDFATPWSIREQAIYEIERGRTAYSSNAGLLQLRVALVDWLRRKYRLEYNPDNEVLITVGASEAIDLALRAILDPGDEVVVVEPCYVSYAPSVVLAGGRPVIFPTRREDAFRIDFDALNRAITPRTRAVMVNYPSNPTGRTLRLPELQQLADLARRHDILILSDEIYAELTYDEPHQSLATLPGMKDLTIIVSGFSKAFAMTGWRIGYACASPEITTAMVKIHQYTMLCAPTISQYAALEALKDCDEDVAGMRDEYDLRRRFITRTFNELGLATDMPEGAFYAFSSTGDTGLESEAFCAELLKAEKVAVVPGTAFGASGEGYFRASYATSFDRLEQAAERMARFLQARR